MQPFLKKAHGPLATSLSYYSNLIEHCFLLKSLDYAKFVHAQLIKVGFNTHTFLGNRCLDLFGELERARDVFDEMPKRDVVSWNTMISGYVSFGLFDDAFRFFSEMQKAGIRPSGFTYSTLLEDSVRVFEEIYQWDSVLCNAMISSYAWHGFGENALQLFVLTLRENLRPTEFTLSIVLSAVSILLPVDQGSQIHSLVVKSGLESDVIVASSLVEMYAKFGLIDSAMKTFAKIGARDLISWNTMIMGLAYNGRVSKALEIFKELLIGGPPPDEITLAGVLLACNVGGLVDEGLSIFSSMEKEYGVIPAIEHYACIVDMMSRGGKLKEAMDIVELMPHEPSGLIWGSLLCACEIYGDLRFTERVAERVMELEPQSSLPYLVLAQAYEMRGRWESLVRVRRAMKEKGVRKVIGCSWIGIKNHVFVFKENQLLHIGGKDIYFILRLLIQEIEDDGYASQQYDKVRAVGEVG
uniref:Pentatricopeptide repeat-containing protein n=1 Tax=Vitis vinifera TaxID=29760 RepID=F6GZT9_VITVI